MKKQVNGSVCLLAVIAAFLLGVSLCLHFGRFNKEPSVIESAQQVIATEFVGDYDEAAVTEGAIQGMVDALGDRWSYYLTADQYDAYEASVENSYVGIGVVVERTLENGGFKINRVETGGPAETAGLKAGEWILAANGQSFARLTAQEATQLVSGAEGTEVTLTIRSVDGAERSVTLTRATVESNPVSHSMLAGNVGYIQIMDFDRTASQYAKEAVADLQDKGAAALVFDLRNNPGGLLTELLELLDDLLPEGTTFISQDVSGKETVYTSDASCVDLPVAVLVNEETYSAAEYFAAIFQESGRGIVVGTQTCGKGYSQVPIRLSDGSALVLSTGKYYTPNRVSLIGTGVIPDAVVPLTEEQNTALLQGTLSPENDPQLKTALSRLTQA